MHLQTFSGYHSPTSCYASPTEVLAFAYRQQELDLEVLATFHTHPEGQSAFSRKDLQLSDWATLHLLLSKRAVSFWKEVWGESHEASYTE